MIRAFQWDLARQVERLDWLLAQLPRYADWGYNELYIHLEDAVEYPSLPGVARRDAYTYKQFGRLVNAATRAGIKVVPIVNLLGHTQYLIKVPALRDLNELRTPDGSAAERGQICPLHPRTLEIAGKLLHDMAPFCTAGKVHAGLDESFHLGKHPLSQKEIARIGLAAHFAGHVNRLHEITHSLGLRMGMWADMLYFLPQAIPLLPRQIAAYEWYYYKFARRPRVELFNFAESDIGERLRARGIEYWGCPMNGAFRHEPLPHFTDRLENITAWWKHCHRTNAAGFLVTSWEPNRLALELTTVVDAAAASLWLEPGETDPRTMLERGFARVFGKSRAKEAARAALACDAFPFSGYPRWQLQERWDVIPRREPMREFQQAKKALGKIARRARELPTPLRASVEFRHCLAMREVFVREEARLVTAAPGRGAKAQPRSKNAGQRTSLQRFEVALQAALRAARTMWSRTRDPRVRGPNEQIIRRDLQRLQAWKKGEPVFGGRWQLCYRVNNFAPAAQLVAVEQQRDDGTWETLQACHTIEFQARAARPRQGLTRTHAAPVRWDGDEENWPRLRFALRGIGQVRLANVELTDGRAVTRGRLAKKTLGTPAPRSGFPELDWAQNRDVIAIRFAAGA